MLGIGIALGAVFLDGSSPSTAQTTGDGAIQALSYETAGPSDRETVLDLGGLRVTAACNQVGRPPFDLLSVTARSEFSGASAVSSFIQDEGRDTHPYVFALRHFEPSYGAWDFLGSPYKVSGDLHYLRPDGGQVSVSYVADQGRTDDGCRFGGTAVYAPD